MWSWTYMYVESMCYVLCISDVSICPGGWCGLRHTCMWSLCAMYCTSVMCKSVQEADVVLDIHVCGVYVLCTVHQ